MVVDLNNEFKLEKKIGEGGLCSIWETRHRDSNEVFAFKQIKEASEINLQAILDEYRFLKFHPHPGIVEVYDFNRIDNLLGIIMEYLPGPTLENDCGNLDDDTLLATLVGILEVVNFVHHCGYIYNDYKPQNFTYDSAGKLKLIDFNLIRPQDSQDGTRSGTFGYLAPELLTGSPVSVQSDIYSLGATFYELATGTLPFIAPDEGALIKMITEATPEKPKTSNEKLNHAIMMMLSLSPEDRPSNAFETAGLLGLEVELRAKVKTNYQIYLEAGFWPYSLELVNSIKDNQNTRRPVVVVSSNEHEHDGFIKDAAILAKLEFDSAEILSGKQSTPIADSNFTVRIPSNKHNSVNSDKQSNRIRGSGKSDSGELSPQYLKDEIRRFATDSRSAKRLHLVDCQSVFDESIAALIESYDSEKLKYDDLILFAHALDIDRYANHLHI
ncbi:MAG: serine/threonine protein kinase, partial [candidate division Zixibacteria bacterium]|nr:serine/threonine protein kinase [candidate division Zixibacteria bacterium]